MIYCYKPMSVQKAKSHHLIFCKYLSGMDLFDNITDCQVCFDYKTLYLKLTGLRSLL